jgi:AraC-like DNA-binding protein
MTIAVGADGLPDTNDDAVGIAATLVRTFALGLARFGVDPSELLGEVGLGKDARAEYVPDVTVARALADIGARKGIDPIGLELASSISLGWFGNVDYQFSTSATLGDALANANPSLDGLVRRVRRELEFDGDTARIVFHHLVPHPDATSLTILSDLGLAVIVRRLRDVLGEEAVRLSAVRFVHAAPSSTAVYEEFFRAPVSFGCDLNEIAFPRELLAAPLMTADQEIARALRSNRSTSKPAPPDGFLDGVRAAIRDVLADGEGGVGVEAVAVHVSLSGRSLQRKLQERGVSFSTLIEEERRALAEVLLERQGILLCDVAYRLGFNDVKAFFRAFRKWTGTSPRAFQKARREQA